VIAINKELEKRVKLMTKANLEFTERVLKLIEEWERDGLPQEQIIKYLNILEGQKEKPTTKG